MPMKDTPMIVSEEEESSLLDAAPAVTMEGIKDSTMAPDALNEEEPKAKKKEENKEEKKARQRENARLCMAAKRAAQTKEERAQANEKEKTRKRRKTLEDKAGIIILTLSLI